MTNENTAFAPDELEGAHRRLVGYVDGVGIETVLEAIDEDVSVGLKDEEGEELELIIERVMTLNEVKFGMHVYSDPETDEVTEITIDQLKYVGEYDKDVFLFLFNHTGQVRETERLRDGQIKLRVMR